MCIFVIGGTTKLLSHVLVPSHLLPEGEAARTSPPPCQHWAWPASLTVTTLTDVWWRLTVILTFIFLMSNDLKHLFFLILERGRGKREEEKHRFAVPRIDALVG